MPCGEGNENSQKNLISQNELCTCGTLFSLISKKTTLHAFLVHFFAVVLHEYNGASRNFLVTRFMEEMLNVL